MSLVYEGHTERGRERQKRKRERGMERDERAANYAMTVEAVQISEQKMKKEDGKMRKKQRERLAHTHMRRIRNALK